jgi:hypothetical protein
MTLPEGIAELLEEFAGEIRPAAGAVALYVGGSLATGDYQPGISDMDLAAVTARPLSPAQQSQVQDLHRQLIARYPAAGTLHCVYVPADELADIRSEHPTWAVQQFFRRAFSGVARAEILRHGFAVFGPPAATLIPGVTAAELDQAVRNELTGYWSEALTEPKIWLEDTYVDLSLITLARAQATLAGDGLITKREALARLARFNVPISLIEEIRARRAGRPVPVSPAQRLHRAWLVHGLVADGIRSLAGASSTGTLKSRTP